ncbi:MAG: outer membrane lipoprotein carrier protein LolA [Gammaproteobacteria bacterium RIFCSPHIGHO2_12_FULL_45_9]|nr:MAG: outer membrane lipoprotein carrier protein LolA [Gammaproteobacteria bacterium RIFCSPHIGHO2_12_FULL_45_9]
MQLKRYYILTLFFIGLLWVFSLYAATPADTLAQLFTATQTMQADFTQTIFDNHGKSIQRSQGHMAFQRPGKFRWDVRSPLPQLVVANGQRLWIYDADLEQVVIRSLHQSAGETPALLLSRPNPVLQTDFKVSEGQGDNKGMQWFILTPKKNDNMFEQIRLGFRQEQIQAMRLTDHLGHSTLIEFHHIHINTALSSSLFSFVPKSGVDVIDETQR